MSDSPSGTWLGFVLDTISSSLILVAVEELGRSFVPHGGPTMPTNLRFAFAGVGIVCSFAGRRGSKAWKWILDTVTRRGLKEENQRLRLELAKLSHADAQRRVDAAHDPEGEILIKLSDAARVVYGEFRANLINLPWRHKIALKRVCQAGVFLDQNLENGLNNDGFRDPGTIVRTLVDDGLLQRNSKGMLSPPMDRMPWMEAIFKNIKLC